MYIFSTYFTQRNFRSHFLRKFLTALANKMCDVSEDEKFQLEERNTVVIFERAFVVATYDAFSCMYPRVEFLIGSLLPILKANDFNRDGCRTLIIQFPCRKMKSFLFAQIISEKIASTETLKWGILYLFPCSGSP